MRSAVRSAVLALAAVLPAVLPAALIAGPGDPLRPPGYGGAENSGEVRQKPSWHVNQILLAENRRVAVINNTTVARGEYVNGARVLDITPTHVELKHEGRVFKVRFSLVPVKRHRNNTVNN